MRGFDSRYSLSLRGNLMHKRHKFKEIDFSVCPTCKQKDFIKEKCTDAGCDFVNTRSPLCKCSKKDLKNLKKNIGGNRDNHKRSTWHGM